jgi:hypothetical protein
LCDAARTRSSVKSTPITRCPAARAPGPYGPAAADVERELARRWHELEEVRARERLSRVE